MKINRLSGFITEDQEVLKDRHSREFKTLEFIARNVIYPDRPSPGGNYVSLENMMTRLGGTGGQKRILKK